MSAVQSVAFVPTVDVEIVAAYQSADGAKAKAAIRSGVQSDMMAAVMALDAELAASLGATLAALTTAAPTKKVVDPRQVIADRIAVMEQAITLLRLGSVIPTGLTFEPSDNDFKDGYMILPEVSLEQDEIVSDAIELASQKLTRSDKRRSIQAAIERAFEGKPEGTFLTVSQISRLGAIEGYKPSTGAIAVRLFPTKSPFSLVGVEPVERNGSVAAGARLI